MRPRYVDPHHLGPLLRPPRGRQDAIRCVFWTAHPYGSHDPRLGREEGCCYQPHIPITNGDVLPSKPERDALLLFHPEGMIHRPRPSTDLCIPLEQRRVLRLPLDHLDASRGRLLANTPLPLQVKVWKDRLHPLADIKGLRPWVCRTHGAVERLFLGKDMLEQGLSQPA